MTGNETVILEAIKEARDYTLVFILAMTIMGIFVMAVSIAKKR